MKRKFIQDRVRDVVIGMSDGLTVPFALLAGLSGATHSTLFVIIGGISEIAAGSISMGLGGYLASCTEDEFEGSDGTEASTRDAILSSITIGLSYIVGGIVPLSPYLVFFHFPIIAQIVSVVFTLVVLFAFGAIKGKFTKRNKFKSGMETLIVGGLACAIAYIAAKLVSGI